MSARVIRSVFQALGLSNKGRFEEKVNAEMQRLIEALEQHPEEKAKGTLTLTVDFTKLGDRIDMKPSVKAKLPEEKGFTSTPFWVVDGGLSVQHPSQADMFGGPSEVGERRRSAEPA
ncbi:hypothetical protein AncyloWKF20_05300 [Ancylobacter sp. WKF20]|uniref:hypothetical protein n=1 Tax=Ancylobacter sp. WKF20 TaxID=3039801 RepID=UPI0024344AFB|nr:hypothetical protein [Ancylobacter sp. WKF20]WGD31241.1 hypothetical protein AncyloWKF20_05300 [Ancylobacter sp. WKF20]